MPHQDAASRAAHRPVQEPLAGWSLEEGGKNSLQGALAERRGGLCSLFGVSPIQSAQAQPLGVLNRKTIKEPAPMKCGCQTLEIRNGGLGLNPGPVLEEGLSAAPQASQCHTSGK